MWIKILNPGNIWYKDQIGSVLNVEEAVTEGCYKVKGSNLIIDKNDCQILNYDNHHNDLFNKLLIRFMELKQKELSSKYNYFTLDDSLSILNWSYETAEYVAKEIDENSRIHRSGLRMHNCPFCMCFRCDDCPYAQKHGKCPRPGSDYSYIPPTLISGFNWTPLWERAKYDLGIKELTVSEEELEKRMEIKKYLEIIKNDANIYAHTPVLGKIPISKIDESIMENGKAFIYFDIYKTRDPIKLPQGWFANSSTFKDLDDIKSFFKTYFCVIIEKCITD